MNFNFIELTFEDFNKLNVPLLFGSEFEARCFGTIKNEKIQYKLAWQSTGIKPLIKYIGNDICSIGVDLFFVIINSATGDIGLNLLLDYFFYDSKVNNEYLYIITELEIIEVLDSKVFRRISLPDFYSEMEFEEKVLRIRCINDQILTLELPGSV